MQGSTFGLAARRSRAFVVAALAIIVTVPGAAQADEEGTRAPSNTATPASAPPPSRTSSGLRTAGFVMMPAGALLTTAGVIFVAVGGGSTHVERYGDVPNERGYVTAGVPMIVGGVALLGTGLAFTLIGGARSTPAAASPRASVGLGPGSIVLTGRF